MPNLLRFLLCLLSLGVSPAFAQTPEPAPRFDEQTIDDDVAIGYGLAIGDVDGDRRPDILLADKKQFVWYRNPDWQRFVMVENLTEHDNVALTARDLDGDGRVEVAVGAQWNPGETTDPMQSGSVHYLVRPADPTQRWRPVQLVHDPTVHRMHWAMLSSHPHLVVLPLHGVGNQGGEGEGVRFRAYALPEDPMEPWPTMLLDSTMHLTHNFDVIETERGTRLLVAGKEGVRIISVFDGMWWPPFPAKGATTHAAGEVRIGQFGTGRPFVATIEPMHGTHLVVYDHEGARVVLDSTFAQGHALATGDLLGLGRDQVVAGWRNPNAEGKVGLKLYVPHDATGREWTSHWLDEDGMATEDLKVADLNGDDRPDIIAAGRATNNLKIYWNRTGEQLPTR